MQLFADNTVDIRGIMDTVRGQDACAVISQQALI